MNETYPPMAKIYANLRPVDYGLEGEETYDEEEWVSYTPPPPPHCYPEYASAIDYSLLPQLSIARADPLSQVFSLKWNNHRSNMINVFERLLSTEAFCDVTLACEGGSIKCHRIVLSASSVYFEKLFLENTCDHPIVFLKDVKEHQMRAIIEYMYRGDVNISQEELPALLRVAELLRVKGMQEEPSALLSRSSRDHDSRSSRVSLKEGGMSSSTCTTPTPGSATIKPPGTPEPNRSSTPRSRDADRERSSPTPTTRSSSPMLHHPLNGGGRSLDRQMSGNRSRTPPLLPGIPHLPPNVSSTSSLLPRPPSASTIPVSGLPPNFRPFLTPPGGHGGHGGGPQGTTAPFPMWPLPGLFPGHPAALFNPVRDMQDIKPLSPVTKDRSKLGDKGDMPPLMPRENGDKDGYERHNGDHMDPYGPDGPLGHHKSPKMPPYPNGGKNGGAGDIAGYVPTQRLEWKRYKQYTRSDIMAAIEEVKKGKSALQVSKKFNIPSRTLYDKVKKMGITTGRQQQRKSMGSNFNAYTAAFPGMNMMSPLSRLDSINLDNPYKDLMERMREARDEEDRDSRESEGLPAAGPLSHHPHSGNAPPPFSILSPQMLNMMDRMKADLPPRPHSVGEGRQSSGEGERTSGDGGDTSPMNLSSEREDKQRASEGSIPQSPSPGSTELTSPSNPHTSPSGGDYRHSRRSPPPHPAPIDIRAQFLADLRHNLSMSAHSPHSLHHHPMVSAHLPHAARGLVAPAYHHRRHRSDSPIHADETEDERGVSIDERADNEDTRASSPDDNDRGSTSTPNNGHDLSSKSPVADSLPPRKRRLSGSLAADSSTGAAAKLGAPGLNGLHGLGHPEDSQPSATQVN